MIKTLFLLIAFCAGALHSQSVVHHYSESFDNFTNPERGWIAHRKTDDMWGLDQLASSPEKVSIILIQVDLSQSKELDHVLQETLNETAAAFEKCRTYGLKALFRAAYDNTGAKAPDPSSLDRILTHIADFSPLFHQYSDVLIACEAGFLGPWGEWHSSSHSTDTTKMYYPIAIPAAQAVHAALIEALPGDKQVIIRRPYYIRKILETDLPLSEEEAFNGTPISRTGFHNDAYLNNESDAGTYELSAPWGRANDLAYVHQMSRFTYFGGETFGTPNDTYNNGDSAYAISRYLHMNYLNRDYQKTIYQAWGEVIYNRFTRELGYRFVLDSLSYPASIAAGETVTLMLYLRNVGFSALHSLRSLYVVLENGDRRILIKSDADPRFWEPEMETIALPLSIAIPDSAENCHWRVSLHFPDPDSNLAADSRYSIRLANAAVWDAASGMNRVVDSLYIGERVVANQLEFAQQILPQEGVKLAPQGSITLHQQQIGAVRSIDLVDLDGRRVERYATPFASGGTITLNNRSNRILLLHFND